MVAAEFKDDVNILTVLEYVVEQQHISVFKCLVDLDLCH